MIYLDSSAIVKLIRLEPGSRALLAYLRPHTEHVTSVVTAVEVSRAAQRAKTSARVLQRAERVLGGLGLIELDRSIRARAVQLEPTTLRTLDAIQVASALEFRRDVAGFVTYDDRQAAAARDVGMNVVSPRD